ncbi:hypothetical protein ASF08_10635 [Methylobacterium sp. Leaf85]|nr:hypothetical protein ASF08_10635 [Methylobacterium sp. Leaf85]
MPPRFIPLARIPHPSGRPLREPERRGWAYAQGPNEPGFFRTPRLNAPPVQHIRQATDVFAVGFVDHTILDAQSEFE